MEFELPPIVLAATAMRSGTLIDKSVAQSPVPGFPGIRGNRQYGFAETNGRGEFSLQLPKTLAMDSIRSRDAAVAFAIAAKPTIVKHEPLTLQFDLTSAGENPRSQARTGSMVRATTRGQMSTTNRPSRPHHHHRRRLQLR